MNTLMIVTTMFPVVLIACLLPVLGRSRRGVMFGVTVPLEFAASAEAKLAVRRYRGGVALVVLVVGVALLLVMTKGRAGMLPIMASAGVGVELLGGLLLWQSERRRMKAHSTTVPLERSAELLPQRHLGGIYASVAALLPLALEAAWLRSHWAMIPARWPQHWDAYGHANGWGTRSVVGVFFPLMMGAGIVGLMAVMAAFIALAPGPQSKQRRLVTAPIAGLSWVLAGTFCGVALLPLRHGLSTEAIVAAAAVHLLATAGVVVWLVWRTGAMNTGAAAEPYDSTPDAMWRAGILYYNPHDAAVIVPKRYGMGWTLNFARPVAWVYLGGVLVVALAAGVVPLLVRK